MKIIKLHYLNVSLVIVLVVLLFQLINIRFIHQNSDTAPKRQLYTVETFKTGDNGWGYSILCGGKMVIRQDIIPAIQQSIPFQSEKDAKETAHLVIKKLNHKMLPVISVDELDSLRVLVLTDYQ